MKAWRSVLVAALTAGAVWITLEMLTARAPGTAVASPPTPNPGEVHLGAPGLEERIAVLERELEALAFELSTLRALGRSEVSPLSDATLSEVIEDGAPASPQWFLKQYVLSFQGGGKGSEYFRLAVDAYAPALLEDIARLIGTAGESPLLRQRLIEILGDPRFQALPEAVDTLLRVLETARVHELGSAALVSLGKIGDVQTARALEQRVWQLPWPDVQRETITLVVQLARADANATIYRLLIAAPDEQRAFLIGMLQPAHPELALDAFRLAASFDQPVRLQAAKHIARFRAPEIIRFVEEWASTEPDEAVRRELGRARSRLNTIPQWGVAKAVGPPDAVNLQDDPNAWCTKRAEMGEQWLELTYPTPMRAHMVRIYEVNTAGCVSKVIGIEPSGKRHTLFSGLDPTTHPGVFEVQFPLTSYPIQSVRVVLDTNRRTGWSEIDAVELVGPSSRAWARSATASSSYGE